MFILIGCPVYKREWILPLWFEAIEKQSFPLDQIGFLFEVDPQDESTLETLKDYKKRYEGRVKSFFIQLNTYERHETHQEGIRAWSEDRYHAMSRMRNRLLAVVREFKPDRYFSLDSDILLENPDTIRELVQLTAEDTGIDAVSPLTFMTPDGIGFPNSMTWGNKRDGYGFRQSEYPLGSLYQSDVIMAAVMMSPKVYFNVNYEFNRQGEDLGWSWNCKQKGYDLFIAGHLFAAHIMSQAQLTRYLRDGDERAQVCSGRTV